jgi:hypothetical protein
MAFGRKAAIEAPQPPRRRSLVASAIRTNFSDLSWNTIKWRDETWQRELWRYYDLIPEFSFASRWVGQCCSRVRIYVAKVDELGRVQGEVKDPRINALADSLLGGPASKAEALRAMGINLTVAGECFVVGRPNERPGSTKDEWYILSPTEMRKIQGANGTWYWAWDMPDGVPFKLDLDQNVVTRVWTPHPQRIWCADSPSRSCQMILRELEQLTKYIFSQIDSRLINAGVFIIPNNLDLPAEENTTNSSESLMYRFATAASASLRGEGTALGVLPHIIESDNPDGFQYKTFESELSKQAMELRKEAVERLGVGMDMPPEVLSGLGDSNHWNSFLIDGYGIKVHIEPLMNRICDALTKAYLYPALEFMGKDPERYTYSFDTSPLQVRTQRLQDALNLYEKNELSGNALREAGYFKESDAPSVEESARRFIQEILLRDPQMFQNQAVREASGIPEEVIPQSSMIAPTAQSISMGPGGGGGGAFGGGGGSGPPPPPAPPTGIINNLPPPIPDTLGKVGAPPGPPTAPPTGIQASANARQLEEMGVIVLAEATVRRALEVAGKKSLDRHERNRWPHVPAHELHTRIKVPDRQRAEILLAGAWSHLDAMTKFVSDDFDTEPLQKSLHKYCVYLLLNQIAHEPPTLLAALQADGVIHA